MCHFATYHILIIENPGALFLPGPPGFSEALEPMRASPNTEPLHEHQEGLKIDWLPPHLTPCLLFYPWVLRVITFMACGREPIYLGI